MKNLLLLGLSTLALAISREDALKKYKDLPASLQRKCLKTCKTYGRKQNRATLECKERKQCKLKCKEGQMQHPRKLCSCTNKKMMEKKIQSFNALLTRCGGPPEKWARCGGQIEKCTMYSPYNWSKCKCEKRNYCKKGCPSGQALDPGHFCKCVDFLDEVIPSDLLVDANDGECDEDHYYNEDADFCVAYNWCPKNHNCAAGRTWNQDDCDCKWDGSGPDPGNNGGDNGNGGEVDGGSDGETDPVTPTPGPTEPTPVIDCTEGYKWDDNLGYCIDAGIVPVCNKAGQEWSQDAFACVWKKNQCDRIACPNNKQGRWYKNACRCFTDKAWCRLQNCPRKTQGFALKLNGKNTCKCYSLQDSCKRKQCPGSKKPAFFNGRCACYSNAGLCRIKDCPSGKRGFYSNRQCKCLSKQEECSSKDCSQNGSSNRVGFFMNGKCSCKTKDWICSLKKCGSTKSPFLFRGTCICMLNKDQCSRKKCHSTMEPRWNKGACRCFLKEQHCSKLKCLSTKEGHWANSWCRCFWKESSCKQKKCPKGHFSAWFKDRCRCFSKYDDCASKKTCPISYKSVKSGRTCKCKKDETWTPPKGLCGNEQVWSKKAWGCIDGQSTCKGDRQWNVQTQKCTLPKCSSTQSWSSSERRCVCKDGTYWDDDLEKCEEIDCGAGWKYDSEAGSCAIDPNYVHNCPDKMRWSQDSNRCVCNTGFYYSWKTTSCEKVDCGNKRKWSKSREKCIIPDCDRNQIWRRNGACQCRQRQYMSSSQNTCIKIPQCELGDMWSLENERCIQDPNYVGDCQDSEEWSRKQRKCICIDNYYRDPSSEECALIDCDNDQKWSKKWLKCRPRTCPQYMLWDDEMGSCQCNEDRFWSNRQKRCIPIYCKDGFKFNFKLETCVRKGSPNSPNPNTPSPTPSPNTPKPRCRSYQKVNPETNTCVCKKACGKGRKHNVFCRCSIRTPDCPKQKRCSSWRYRWNGAEGKCKCEKFLNR